MAFRGVLEGSPSFGTQLARGLGSGIGAGISGASDVAGKLALKQSESKQMAKLLGGNQGQESSGFQPLEPQKEAMLALTNPSAFKAYETLKVSHEKKQEKAVLHEDIGNVLNGLTKTLKGGNLGYTVSKYTKPEGRRDAQYFDSLGLQLESIGKELISKGVLSRDRFAYLLSNLPSSDKTDASNAGAIEAWSDELKIPRPEGLESFYKKGKKGKKSSASEESSDMVKMRGPDGSEEMIPKSKVKAAMQAGAIVTK